MIVFFYLINRSGPPLLNVKVIIDFGFFFFSGFSNVKSKKYLN